MIIGLRQPFVYSLSGVCSSFVILWSGFYNLRCGWAITLILDLLGHLKQWADHAGIINLDFPGREILTFKKCVCAIVCVGV